MRTAASALVVLLVVLAGCNLGPATPGPSTPTASSPTATPSATDAQTTRTGSPTATGPTPTPTATPVATRADPASDRLGWEDGYWYDDAVVVDRSDGLNDSELDAVVARGMARVERIRQLEFEERVPVEVVSREEFRTRSSNRSIPAAARLHQNVKWEATFMVGESTDAVATRQSTTGATVGGYYSPSEERIVIVSENATAPKMDEITLAQELFHALQDQRFDLTDYDQSTEELHNARDGIIEGDGNYVDYLYGQRCEAEWDCLLPEPAAGGGGGGGGGGGDVHVGQFVVSFAPYSEGPEFVRGLQQRRGWDAVDAVYADPPASTEQIIHPETYGSDEPTRVEVADRSSNGWHVLDLEGGVDHAQFGEAGLFAMFWYASFEKSRARGSAATVVVPYTDFFEYEDGPGSDLEAVGPYSYDHEVTAGWDGDRLVPYVDGSSAATNETGYVWKTEWDSERDAREFVRGYEELLAYHGATAVEGRPGTYRIPDGEPFGDAFAITRDGSTVVVVNAPTVDALDDVRAGAGTAG